MVARSPPERTVVGSIPADVKLINILLLFVILFYKFNASLRGQIHIITQNQKTVIRRVLVGAVRNILISNACIGGVEIT